MKTTITICIDHHVAVSIIDRLGPVLDPLVNQVYAVNHYSIDYKEDQ